jgi:hypothetical protein
MLSKHIPKKVGKQKEVGFRLGEEGQEDEGPTRSKEG